MKQQLKKCIVLCKVKNNTKTSKIYNQTSNQIILFENKKFGLKLLDLKLLIDGVFRLSKNSHMSNNEYVNFFNYVILKAQKEMNKDINI